MRISYKVGKSDIDASFGNNASEIASLNHFIDSIKDNPHISISSVNLLGSVSPEGPRLLNERLLKERLASLEKYILRHVNVPVNDISRCYNAIESDASKSEWPKMRYAMGEIIVEIEVEPEIGVVTPAVDTIVADTIITTPAVPIPPDTVIVEKSLESTDTAIVIEPVALPAPQSCNFMSVKTNAIGWAMLIANVTPEIEFAHRWSFALPVYYSAMNYFKSTLKFRTLTLQPEIRYWFKDHCADGGRWYIGAHFGMGYFNYALDGDYRIQDHQGRNPAVGGGVSAGYRMDLSQNGRWKLEITLGAGVYHCNYDKFINVYYPNGPAIATSVKKIFYGIDNAAVSVCYRFNL